MTCGRDHLEVTAGVDMDAWTRGIYRLGRVLCEKQGVYSDSKEAPVEGLKVSFEGLPSTLPPIKGGVPPLWEKK